MVPLPPPGPHPLPELKAVTPPYCCSAPSLSEGRRRSGGRKEQGLQPRSGRLPKAAWLSRAARGNGRGLLHHLFYRPDPSSPHPPTRAGASMQGEGRAGWLRRGCGGKHRVLGGVSAPNHVLGEKIHGNGSLQSSPGSVGASRQLHLQRGGKGHPRGRGLGGVTGKGLSPGGGSGCAGAVSLVSEHTRSPVASPAQVVVADCLSFSRLPLGFDPQSWLKP